MRRIVLASIVLAAVLAAGCGTSGTLDPAVVADLRAAVTGTLDAMAMPAAARPSPRALEDQVNLLALQVDPARLEALRSGEYGLARLRDDAADLGRWLDRQRSEHAVDQQPPAMIAFLAGQDRLDARQRVLLHALIRQAQRETGYKPSDR